MTTLPITKGEIPEYAKAKLQELKKATDNFEAIYVKKLLSTMRSGVKHVSFGDTMGQEMYQDMMDQAIADSAAKTGSFGFSEILYNSFAPKVIAIEELRHRVETAAKGFNGGEAPQTEKS